MSRSVILSTARTPFGKMGGALSSLDATKLGGQAIGLRSGRIRSSR
jgi:acetyl-CoA C-acetyltransferase